MGAIITSQPDNGQLLAAYKPIVISCTASTDDGKIPALVLCDVYINSLYYRTFFSSKAEPDGQYYFDICDAVQEKVTSFFPPINGVKIEVTKKPIVDVFVKCRTAKINSAGLFEPEQNPPIPGNNETLPLSGHGEQSNSFLVLNAVIQVGENPDLRQLLNQFKSGKWETDSLPLTRRHQINRLRTDESSFFPLITNKEIGKIKLHAMFRGDKVMRVYERTINWEQDVNEITNPPVVDVKWLTSSGQIHTNNGNWDLKNGEFPSIQIIAHPSDPDNDIVKTELFVNDGSGWQFVEKFGSSNISIVQGLQVGEYSYKAIVTDSRNNSAESNLLRYIVKDTTPIPGTITLQEGDTITLSGGTYRSKPMAPVSQIPSPDPNPDPGEQPSPDAWITNYSIDFGLAFKNFYAVKGMQPEELRIQFLGLIGYNSWRYNNSLITETNYSNKTVNPSELTHFAASSYFEEQGTAEIYHVFSIYHVADPSQIFTNYLLMQFT